MEKIDVLRKAVSKAKNNGYFIAVDVDTMLFHPNAIAYNGIVTSKDFLKEKFSYYNIIFNHNFARGYWGNDYLTHLQNMVILLDPLEYLTKFVDGSAPAPAAAANVAPPASTSSTVNPVK